MGMLMPQIPTPTATRAVMVVSIPINSRKAMAKPTHQPSGGRRHRTWLEMASVTDPSVWPGAMIGVSAAVTAALDIRHYASSGLKFLTCAKYVVRGRVLRPASNP
jgi:hypothetical protein